MKTLKYCIKNWWDNSNTNAITNILARHYNIIYDDKNPDLIIFLLDKNYFKKKYEEIEQFLVNLVNNII